MINKVYGYIRVLTREQNENQQKIALRKVSVSVQSTHVTDTQITELTRLLQEILILMRERLGDKHIVGSQA